MRTAENMINYLNKNWMKLLALCTYVICTVIWAYINENNLALSALAIFMVVDTITWMIKAYRWWNMKSWELKWWIVSKFLVWLIPFLLALLIEVAWLKWGQFIGWAVALLCVAETISIVQNVYTIKTWEIIEEQDAVTEVLWWILKQLRKMLSWLKK